jgi:hypothetical protein
MQPKKLVAPGKTAFREAHRPTGFPVGIAYFPRETAFSAIFWWLC